MNLLKKKIIKKTLSLIMILLEKIFTNYTFSQITITQMNVLEILKTIILTH